jgi:hypothetical protein
MLIGADGFIMITRPTVFADPGVQGIDVNAEIFGYLSSGFI